MTVTARHRTGTSGLKVSRIGLGTMSWGEDTDAEAAAAQLAAFVDAGGTLVETADAYGGGAAQDVLGTLLAGAGKYAGGTPADSRAASAARASYVEARRNERSARIVQAVLTAADGLGTSPLAVALAWVRDRPGVAATVVGARDAAQLAASMAAEAVTLPAAIRSALDDVSAPG